MNPEIENIPHGPVYGGTLSNVGIGLVCFNLLATALTSETLPICFFFGTLLILSFVLFMNYMGIEINYNRKKIRLYHSFLGMRWGEWQDLDRYDRVVLYFLSTTTSVSGGNSSLESDFTSRSYTIELIGKTKKDKIELNEIPGYDEALVFAQKYAAKLDKTFVNVIEVALKNRNEDYY